MSSLVTIELGSDAQKSQEQFKKYYNLTINDESKRIADLETTKAAEKLKASIEGVISLVENTVQDIAINGSEKLYESLGINEELITIARNAVTLADNKLDLASSIVKQGLVDVHSFDEYNIPASAEGAALNVVHSVADIFFRDFLFDYDEYIDIAIQYITDPNEAIERLGTLIKSMIEELDTKIDEECQKYLGISFVQIKYWCKKGYEIYKQYKVARKKQRGDKEKTESEQQNGITATGTKKSLEVDYSYNTTVLKNNLDQWLTTQNDAIFNGFIILQVKDAINSIKEMIKMFTDINLYSLAEGMNSLDDLINMLDEFGLGDDSTAIDLSIIPSLNINNIYTSLNSITNMSKIQSDLATLTGVAYTSLVNGTNVSAKINTNKTYDISTDAEKMIITVKFYQNPTKTSIAKEIYKIFNTAKDVNGKKLFSLSDSKVIQENISSLYNKNYSTGKGTSSIKVGKYTIELILDISSEKSSAENESISKNNSKQISDGNEDSKSSTPVKLEVVSEEKTTTPEENLNKKRDTIRLLHTAYSVLKSVTGPIKMFSVLISNYQINKAYVSSKKEDDITKLFTDCMYKLGFKKSKNIKETTDDSGKKTYSLYTVRTYYLYSYLKDTMKVITDSTVTIDIDKDVAIMINKWLSENDTEVSQLSSSQDSTLYIDYFAIQQNKKCIDEKKKKIEDTVGTGISTTFTYCEPVYKNGTFDNIENAEINGDKILFAEKNLPRFGSQILIAQMSGYKYNE